MELCHFLLTTLRFPLHNTIFHPLALRSDSRDIWPLLCRTSLLPATPAEPLVGLPVPKWGRAYIGRYPSHYNWSENLGLIDVSNQ